MDGFSVPVSIAFCVNYVVGAGSLTIPWSFQQSGGILGVIMMIAMAFFSLSAILFIVETIARADALNRNKGSEFQPLNKDDTLYDTFGNSLSKNLDAKSEHYLVGNRKFEISELCEIFLGYNGKIAYAIIICIYMYGTLWVFGTVFGHAISSHFILYSSPETSYLIFLILYGCIVIPVSCLELTEQIYIQVTLSICRIMMILLMLSTILIAFYMDNNPFLEFSSETLHYSSSSLLRMDFSKLYILLPIAAYANVFHHSIPALSHPVQDKKKLMIIFLYTTIFCLIAYSLIGCVISSYFGSQIKSSSNLTWLSYSGFTRAIDMANIPLYARLISTYVVCFPALDVGSAYPLCAITLGNNLMSAYYGPKTYEMEKNRIIRILFRLLASIPPLIGASIISDLGKITHFTGITGFVVAFIVPSLLAIASKQRMIQNKLSIKTYYSNILTHDYNIYATLGLGIFLVIFVIFSLCFLDNEKS